ncbi:MAG: (2Fe-2S)-binding protein [Thermodesulfobacteriota bacterium]
MTLVDASAAVNFSLNGAPVTVRTAPDRRVIDLLREDLGLTGSKEGCGTGECGACTILVDGEPRLACLMLAAQLEGHAVETVESLEQTPLGRGLVDAFEAHGAVQCGYCMPGMEMTALALLRQAPSPDREAARRALSGNLCRCTGYVKIIDAVTRVRTESP